MVQFILVVALLLLMCATASAWAPTLATIIVGCLILSIALGGKTALARLFSHPSLVLLGAASYSLYILQFPVREIVRFALAEYGDMLSRLLYIPILIMFSIFIFKFFEEKIRISLRHWRARLQP
jgi:peptidoglycan/LPS O-acetylase OafA/YrhL